MVDSKENYKFDLGVKGLDAKQLHNQYYNNIWWPNAATGARTDNDDEQRNFLL